MPELLYKEEVFMIVGAAMEVYNHLGPSFLEAVYQQALEIELASCSIPFRPQQELAIYYKNHRLRKVYVPDLFCFDKIIVDLKALDHLTSIEFA